MQLVVTDVNGCTTTAIQNGIQAQGSAANFTFVPSACVPANIVFTDSSTVFPVGAIITEHSWDFKNDRTAFAGAAVGSGNYYEYSSPTATTAAYNITAPGTYQMKHVIKTLVGGVTCKDSIIKTGFRGFAPVAYFNSATIRCANQPLPITNTSAGTGALTHTWYVNGVATPALGTTGTPTVSFPVDGVYVLCDEVTEATALGCKDSICRTINVRSPIVDFTGTNLTIPCPPLNPSLVSTSQNLTKLTWEVWPEQSINNGPGNPPTFIRQIYTEPDPSVPGAFVSAIRATRSEIGAANVTNPFDFVLTEAGCYTVKLFGTNASGCRDSLVRNSYICLSGPSADVTVVPTTGCAPVVSTFNVANAVGQTTIAYKPGDGTTIYVHTTAANTDAQIHSYGTPGIFQPLVLLSDGLGCDVAISPPLITVDSASGWTGYIRDNICIGDSAIIYANSAVAGTTYKWRANATFPVANDTMRVLTVGPLVTTTYTVTITDPNGCAKIATITVTVKNVSKPTVTIAPGTPTICFGASVLLTATGVQDGTTIGNATGYNWDTGSPFLSQYASIINPLASPIINTTYTVTVTGVQGCTAIQTVDVDVIQPIIEMLGADHTICKGGSIGLSILSSADVNTPEWGPRIALTTIFSPTTTANPTTTQGYWVTAKDNLTGCPVRDTVTVFVLQPGAVSAGVDKAICLGTPVTLSGSVPTGTATGAGGTIIWRYDLGGAQLIAPDGPFDIITPSVNPTVESKYIIAYTIDQCIQEDTVTVFPLATATIEGTGGSICRNATIQLNVTGFSNFYTWTPSNTLTADNINNPIASPTETTTYTVVGSLGGNCATASTQVTVSVNQLPALTLTPQNTTFFPNRDRRVTLTAITDPSNGIVWTPLIVEPTGPDPVLTCYTGCQKVDFIPPVTGDKYQYLVTVTDANTCTNTAIVTLNKRTECEDSQMFVPTAFSPNGDGKNDVLYARGNGVSNSSILFRVFDRWGNMMFETTNITKGWDGTYQGKMVNPDVYVYYLEAPCTLDAARMLFQKGNVTVIR
jgi:gliding motility-associated-like protein